ncbi:MAG: cytochrome c [Brevundimonas sp.]|nr:MAG: cytochrome c [Brevundimonas sp.]
MRRLTTALMMALMCAGAASAQAPDMTGVIQGRQAALMLSGVAMGSIKASIDAGQPSATQAFNTRALARWAHALPGLFPAGSGAESGVRTKAKAEIWSDRAGFEAKAAAYAAAADRLAELSRGEDAAAFAAQWTEVRASCQSCHDVYRAD